MAVEGKYQLIQCGDHSWAPWSIVCVHLMEGTSHEWIPIPSDFPEVDFDWACPACNPNDPETVFNLDNLRPVCIHCVRRYRRKLDPNFNDD